jgi:DNA-binding SARP family transcriptional activator
MESIAIALLGGFGCRAGDVNVELTPGAQRLVALLAFSETPLRRLHVAAQLWTDATEARANASLRTLLWRLPVAARPLISATSGQLAIGPTVAIDVREHRAAADRLLARDTIPDAQDVNRLATAGELLPDWYEDWVLLERERLRQLRLHALEGACQRLTASGRFAAAARAGAAAIASEPLRESGHRALIELFLAEGNVIEAIRQYRLYTRLLRSKLDLAPSPRLQQLMAPLWT